MAVLDKQVRGRDHPPVRRANHGGVIADPDDLATPGGHERLDRRNEAEFAQVSD
jgi:hypothetical protein